MYSLVLLALQLIITIHLTFSGIISEDQELKPCPKIKPFTNVNVDQVKENSFTINKI